MYVPHKQASGATSANHVDRGEKELKEWQELQTETYLIFLGIQ